jgi:hypothetical protein
METNVLGYIPEYSRCRDKKKTLYVHSTVFKVPYICMPSWTFVR